jgi:YHS domain-containing protein
MHAVRKLAAVVAALSLLALLAAGCQSGPDAGGDKDVSSLPIGNPDPGFCPVMGDEIDPESNFPVAYQGKRYILCCEDCVKRFNKDPEKWVKNPTKPEL